MSSDSDPVRLGVVGLGFMGTTHATNAVEFGHEVVAGADLDAASREEFASEFDAATYEDPAAMYDAEPLDAVAIATPNAAHEAAAVPALERGLDVLCEKPLADSLAAAERIAAAARESEGFCAVDFHNRVSTAAEVFAGYREEGFFGDVGHVRGEFVRTRGIPGVGSWFTNEELSGGGAVVDIGVHAIDFALHLLDFPRVETVSAVTRSQFGTRDDYADPGDWYDETDEAVFDVEDSATAFVRCEGDRTIALEVAWAANESESREFVARGTDAGARMAIGGEDLELIDADRQGVDHVRETRVTDGSLEHTGWEGSAERFLDAVAAGRQPRLGTVEEALTVQRVIDGIYRSAEAGESVSVADAD